MNIIIKPILFLTVLSTLIAVSCKKDGNLNDGLPPLTFEGKNTIGCKINAVPWIPKGYYDLGFGYYNKPTGGGFSWNIAANRFDLYLSANSLGTSITIYLKNNGMSKYPQLKKYLLSEANSFAGLRTMYGLHDDYIRTGWIELLYIDSVNSIVSGKFEFEAHNYVSNTIDRITEGRFDYRNH